MNDLQTLRNLKPYGAVGQKTPEACRTALLEAIDSEPRAHAQPPASRPARSRRILLAAAACAVVIASVPLIVGQRNGSAPDSNTSAVEFVVVADRVERAPAAFELGPGEFLAERSKVFMAESFGPEVAGGGSPAKSPPWIQTEEVEARSWMTSRGELVSELTPEKIPVDFPTAQDRKNWIAAGRPGVVVGVTIPNASSGDSDRPFALGSEMLSYEQLRELPKTEKALRAAIDDFSLPDMTGGARVMFVAQNLLNYPISAQTRSAIFRMLADTPGIEHRSNLTDMLGRSADAIVWEDDIYRNELLYDPATGLDLEHRRYIAHADAVPKPNAFRTGMLTERRTVVARGVVDSKGDLPR